MARVPKYGLHKGIKYNPKRTLFRWCVICSTPFFDIKPRSRKQVCSDQCGYIRKREVYDKKHNPINNSKWNKINADRDYYRFWYSGLDKFDRARMRRDKSKYQHKSTSEEMTIKWLQRERKRLGL